MDNHAHTFELPTPDGKDHKVKCTWFDCDYERFYPSSANTIYSNDKNPEYKIVDPVLSVIRQEAGAIEQILLSETGYYQDHVRNTM
tara:strand:- start:1321 stop:1578 length:258 start_codon:yes stop_codon:yes gene_type:complete